MAWREMNWIVCRLRAPDAAAADGPCDRKMFGMMRPTATRQDRLHESLSLSVSCSSSPILAGAHDFR